MNRTDGESTPHVSTMETAPLEVEQKFRVESHGAILSCLQTLDALELPLEVQCDIYLKHPCRDFGETGEAFRIRLVNDSAVVTYKGARLAGPIKTRSEIEIPLAAKSSDEWLQILVALGFCEVARIGKKRRSFSIAFESELFTVALDDVERLGKFVEIEAIVVDRSSLPTIQASILKLATQFQLDEVEPRSYLRQLMEMDSRS